VLIELFSLDRICLNGCFSVNIFNALVLTTLICSTACYEFDDNDNDGGDTPERRWGSYPVLYSDPFKPHCEIGV